MGFSFTLLYLSMTNRNSLTTLESHHESEDFDGGQGQVFPAIIYDASFCGETVPPFFNAVRILIDGKIKADLSWVKERAAARMYVEQGLRIFWEIDLGLFDLLEQPLSNRTQFLSLGLSLEHFLKTLWKEFQSHSVGLCIYRGTADFSRNFRWDEEQLVNLQGWIKDLFLTVESFAEETQIDVKDFALITPLLLENVKGHDLLKFFCRDVVGEYLTLLSSKLPDPLLLFLMFDSPEIQDPFVMAQLLTKERYPRFYLVVSCKKSEGAQNQLLGGDLAWNGHSTSLGGISSILCHTPALPQPNLGFCLPKISASLPSIMVPLKEALNFLYQNQYSFRIIPEGELAAEWQGLDYLILASESVDSSFKRKLHGFCAAGGIAIVIGPLIGLKGEIPFDGFFFQK